MSLSVWSPIRPSSCTPPSCPSMFPSSSLCWFMCKFMWSWGSAENVSTPNRSSASVRQLTLTWPLRWRCACNAAAVCSFFSSSYSFNVKLRLIYSFVVRELFIFCNMSEWCLFPPAWKRKLCPWVHLCLYESIISSTQLYLMVVCTGIVLHNNIP